MVNIFLYCNQISFSQVILIFRWLSLMFLRKKQGPLVWPSGSFILDIHVLFLRFK
jgi:hypothetical protein